MPRSTRIHSGAPLNSLPVLSPFQESDKEDATIPRTVLRWLWAIVCRPVEAVSDAGKRRCWVPIGRASALASGFLLLAVFPTEWLDSGPSLCLFRNLFEIKCLGCGMTRALSATLHGDLAAALSYNRLVLIVFPFLCFVFLRDGVSILHSLKREKNLPAATNLHLLRTLAMSGDQVKMSFFIAWLAVSLAILLVLMAPFVLSADEIASLIPTCEWRARYNQECPLCGMTTSFILISQGSFKAALVANKASLLLYGSFVINELFAFLFISSRLGRRWRWHQAQKTNNLQEVHPMENRRNSCKP